MAMQSYFGGWHSAIASRKNSEVRLSRIGDATQLEGALPGYRTRSATKQMPQYRRKIFGMDLIRGSLALARLSGRFCPESRAPPCVCYFFPRVARFKAAGTTSILVTPLLTACFFAAARNAAPYPLFAQSTIRPALSSASSGHW